MNQFPIPPVTSLTVFTIRADRRAWAFTQMGLARRLLRRAPGLVFFKLMGAGRGRGFTIRPDWSRYALLAVWRDLEHARAFVADSGYMRRYRPNVDQEWTVLLETLSAHGAWDGRLPFLPAVDDAGFDGGAIAVLTRATIRPMRLRAFWSAVAPVSAALDAAEGLVASVGIGELPFVRQATFSIWSDATAVARFAYRSRSHREVVGRTRKERWYSEELFARFRVVEQHGRPPAVE